jgi:hypothetical protein
LVHIQNKNKQTPIHAEQNTQTENIFYPRIKNLSKITFNKEETKILELGLNYAYERHSKHFLQELIINTEEAIKQLDVNEQGAYRILAHKKIKQIQDDNTTNTLHKRQNYILRQIRTKLKQNNLTITKADKGKTIVIINKDIYMYKKSNSFYQTTASNSYKMIPRKKYQKQVQQTIQKCNMLINKQNKKCLMQIKPQPPTLNAQIKIHKDNEPIRPVINNINAPAYKIAKFLNKWLTNTLQLQSTCDI